MTKTAPLVLVTGPDKLLKFGWWATRFQLWRVGLRATYYSAKREKLPDQIHGIVIGGGSDIDPKHYGATGAAGAVYDASRDRLELEVIALALRTQIPILGICRGAQLINVASGGSLLEDIRPLRIKTPNRNSIFPIKNATISPHSILSDGLDQNKIRINSLHHQVVNKLGKNLTAVAYDDDEFIQAIETSSEQFVLGVQWHPEYMPFYATQTKLFKTFANAIKKRLAKKRQASKFEDADTPFPL